MIFFVFDEKLKIKFIFKIKELILLEFVCGVGKVCEEDIVKLFFRLYLFDKELNEREILFMEEGVFKFSNDENIMNRNNFV